MLIRNLLWTEIRFPGPVREQFVFLNEKVEKQIDENMMDNALGHPCTILKNQGSRTI